MDQDLMLSAIRQLIETYGGGSTNPLTYRPAERESPIEEIMYDVFRVMGLTVEPQILFGRFRVDMVLSSRHAPGKKVILECDGAEFHNEDVDDYRDDVLLALAKMPIIHVRGSAITSNAEECAAVIVKAFLPEHTRTVGYDSTLEVAQEYPDEHSHLLDDSVDILGTLYLRYLRGGGDIRAVLPYPTMTRNDISHELHQRMIVRWVSGQTLETDIPPSSGDQIKYASVRERLIQEGWHNESISFFDLVRLQINLFTDPDDRKRRLDNLQKFEDRRNKR